MKYRVKVYEDKTCSKCSETIKAFSMTNYFIIKSSLTDNKYHEFYICDICLNGKKSEKFFQMELGGSNGL